MLIESSNAIEPRNHASVSVAIVMAASAFFFIPTTLIVLGYYTSQPTGSLVSPLPQGTLSSLTTPTPTQIPSTEKVTPTPSSQEGLIIAAPNESTESASTAITPESASNFTDHVASISAGVTEEVIKDKDIKSSSQIYLSPREGDKGLYSVKSKTDGQFVITVTPPSDIVRYVDYHIVSP